MKFYERVISDFGGYEKCKDILSQPNIDFIMNAQGLREHMLEYRRQHNIFEVGDKVVYRRQCNLIWDGVYNVDAVLADGRVIERDLPTPKEWLSHATDAEIKAGKRLEVS